MNFEDALDLLIANAITCLGTGNPKLRRAVEIAISYRELSSTSAPVISLEQLNLLGAWLAPQRRRADQRTPSCSIGRSA